jgi:hypothetical protein
MSLSKHAVVRYNPMTLQRYLYNLINNSNGFDMLTEELTVFLILILIANMVMA